MNRASRVQAPVVRWPMARCFAIVVDYVVRIAKDFVDVYSVMIIISKRIEE